ncbi:MAG: hypothetical protein R2939_22880 [Kofleriaceae bacterium]
MRPEYQRMLYFFVGEGSCVGRRALPARTGALLVEEVAAELTAGATGSSACCCRAGRSASRWPSTGRS